MSRNPLQTKLIEIIEPVVNAAKLELVDVRFLLEQGGWTLRVQVDVPVANITNITEVSTDRVSLSDCEAISHELSAVLDVEDPITQRSVLDALEARYPMLRGTIRDHVTQERRPFLRFFACEEDLSHEPPDALLPEAVASGAEPLVILGAIAGG